MKYGVTLCLRYIPQNDYNTLSPLHIPMKVHGIIVDEKKLIEGIYFERDIYVVTQDTTYYYNDEFWDSI